MPRRRKSRRKGWFQAHPWVPKPSRLGNPKTDKVGFTDGVGSSDRTKANFAQLHLDNSNRFPILLLLPKELLILVILIGNLKRKDFYSLSQTCVRLHDLLADQSLRQRLEQHFATPRFTLSSPKKILQYLKKSLHHSYTSVVFYQRHLRADHGEGQDCRDCSSENCYIGQITLCRSFFKNKLLFVQSFERSSRHTFWSPGNTNELTGYVDRVDVNVWQSLNHLWYTVDPDYMPVRHWGTRLEIRPLVVKGLRTLPNVSPDLQANSDISMFPGLLVNHSVPGLPLSDHRVLMIGRAENQNCIVWYSLNPRFTYSIYPPAMQLIDNSWKLAKVKTNVTKKLLVSQNEKQHRINC